ncbi:MAG: epoxyqueuosine reductase QueH [Paludibacteraceae bacterium]|nr:epoxyqueuosine reductase QueH [Paludibacteraceae bacterium]
MNLTKNVLLHCCCAPCAAAIIEWLLQNDYKVTLYFYNPNIFPEEEYLIRKNELMRYANQLNLPVVDDDYKPDEWLACVKGLEHEKERGGRCLQCFKMRLLATARVAENRQIPVIATTLASSRWKSLTQIEEAGNWAVAQVKDVQFWAKNWRKDGLQERRRVLLAENNFYNQQYCGCQFSIKID